MKRTGITNPLRRSRIKSSHDDLEKNYGKVETKKKPKNFTEIRNKMEEKIAQEVMEEH